MSDIIRKVVLSVVIACVVILGCFLLGGLLLDVKISVASTVGSFLKTYGTALGILSGIWYFFTH